MAIKENTIIQGDALEVLKNIPDNSIDACITDPPYGLSDHKPDDVLFILKEWLNGNDSLIPNKKGFMGKDWDAFVPPPAVWKEVLRVLKPGAHCLVFAGTRTVDLMGISLRLGGFEIRDEIIWCYGSGFPKSYNIAKGIEAKIKLGSSNWSGWKNLDGNEYKNKTGYTKMQHRGGYRPDYSHVKSKDIYLTTDEAKQWEGWMSSLKPAIEPIIVARKPLEKGLSIVENCLKWGTGGLNVDECRIETKAKSFLDKGRKKSGTTLNWSNTDIKECLYNGESGRFPANLIIDGSEEVEKLFPQTGKSSGGKSGHDNAYSGGWKESYYGDAKPGYGDNGSASRFFYKAEFSEDDFVPLFYCPKASKSERNIGLSRKEKIVDCDRNPDCYSANVPFNRSSTPKANHHPTVKPLTLIEYLVKLTTRKGQTVLDPFIGSGTTGMACKKLGMNYIGIELNPDYIKIAKVRIKNVVIQFNLLD